MHYTELAARRRALKLSQVELAKRLGVHPNSLARWERGELAIRRSKMVRAMLDVIAADLAAESFAQQQAREVQWRKWLRAEGEQKEAEQTPEQRAAAERWFGRH